MTSERSSAMDWEQILLDGPGGAPIASELVAAGWQRSSDPASGCGKAVTFAPGERVAERYVIERFLARGGMGEVYAAYDQTLDECMAIKTPLVTAADDEEVTASFVLEARLARRISHRNVCRVYDLGLQDERPREILHFMTMEYIDGERLGTRARRGMHDPAEIYSIARQILCGLDATHRARVLHRDLKSDNIVLVGSGVDARAVITDFGLACELNEQLQVCTTELSGSAGYMAPEQLLGQPLSPRTDLFAFGVVLYEMLTGLLPFPRSRLRVQAAQRGTPAPTPRIPRPWQPILRRCLRRDASERYPDAASVLRALDGEPQLGWCRGGGSLTRV
ncbi:MAG TPA: serine/threonine-protein kinase [Polyangiaceae bacterium]|jgi:serine/threonine protein kinase|nr:serine/threonine-protein kinase [Polyangiaceae bacterium]